MVAPRIRVDYSALDGCASRFRREADAVRGASAALREALAALEDGDWRGEAASRFFAEARGAWLPSLDRLVCALDAAGAGAAAISGRFREAERAAAAVFEVAPPAAAVAPLPRVYVINGINNTGRGALPLAAALAAEGYDPALIRPVPGVFASTLAQPSDGAPPGIAHEAARVAAGAANTVAGAAAVLVEFTSGGAGETRRLVDWVRGDLAVSPLLPGQRIAFVAHSGGAALAANAAVALEGAPFLRDGGLIQPLDVSDVITLGAPVLDYDAARRVAAVTQLRAEGDPAGPWLRADETRRLAPVIAVVAGLTGWSGALAGAAVIDSALRDPGAGAEIRVAPRARGPVAAHTAYASNPAVWALVSASLQGEP